MPDATEQSCSAYWIRRLRFLPEADGFHAATPTSIDEPNPHSEHHQLCTVSGSHLCGSLRGACCALSQRCIAHWETVTTVEDCSQQPPEPWACQCGSSCTAAVHQSTAVRLQIDCTHSDLMRLSKFSTWHICHYLPANIWRGRPGSKAHPRMPPAPACLPETPVHSCYLQRDF